MVQILGVKERLETPVEILVVAVSVRHKLWVQVSKQHPMVSRPMLVQIQHALHVAITSKMIPAARTPVLMMVLRKWMMVP